MSFNVKPFWQVSPNKNHSTPVIKPLDFIEWLIKRGYRVLRVGNNYVLGKLNKDNKTIKIVDGPIAINDETQLFIKNTSKTHFEKGGKFYVSAGMDTRIVGKNDVLTALYYYGQNLSERIYNDNLPLVKPLQGEFLHDTQDEVYFNFNNGIVKITKSDITLLPSSKLGKKYRYDTDIVSNLPDMKDFNGIVDVNYNNKSLPKSRFETFCELATSKRISSSSISNVKPEISVNYEYSEHDFKTLKSAIGYLLSDYKEGGASKMVLFQDRYLDNVSRQGGNGKTLVVNAIMKLRKGVKISANRINLKQDKFVFQEVNLGDKIIFFDEITSPYFIGNLFNEINNFLPVQKKYQTQFRLEGQDLPKMIGCSNYMIWKPQEVSHSRRIYCVEFGDFFKSVNEFGLRVEDYFNGKFIFEDLSPEEWNSTLKFLFECVQDYLKNGFYIHPYPYYGNQNLLLSMKKYWDLDKMEWVKDYLTTTRLNEGHFISPDHSPFRKDLYTKFSEDLQMSEYDKRKFSEPTFGKMFYQISKLLGYEYNPTQSHVGDSMNMRKITRKCPIENKSCYVIHITHESDKDFDLSLVKQVKKTNSDFQKKQILVEDMG
jgi:hypothetical protein